MADEEQMTPAETPEGEDAPAGDDAQADGANGAVESPRPRTRRGRRGGRRRRAARERRAAAPEPADAVSGDSGAIDAPVAETNGETTEAAPDAAPAVKPPARRPRRPRAEPGAPRATRAPRTPRAPRAPRAAGAARPTRAPRAAKPTRAPRATRAPRPERAAAPARGAAPTRTPRTVGHPTKEILINVADLESRVAVLEDGRLVEMHVEREAPIVGNLYLGKVQNVLVGMDAAFVDIGMGKNAFLPISDMAIPRSVRTRLSLHGGLPPINKLLHEGDEILVQVIRAGIASKGPRVSTRIALPGRYLVLLNDGQQHIGISRKIEHPKERERVRQVVQEMRPPDRSLIIRTEADGISRRELEKDLEFLVELDRRIAERAKQVKAPALIHQDLTLVYRVLRDQLSREVKQVLIDSPAVYENAVDLVEMISPTLSSRVRLYREPLPLFAAMNLEDEIERLFKRRVWLPGGGHITIDETEAFTAIDVNTGRFTGAVDLEATVFQTNLQAADETARQLRLRDLGGLIIVDFIDMERLKNRRDVHAAFTKAMARDHARSKVLPISDLGMVEMTRKRTGATLLEEITESCPYCSGLGRVRTPQTMALQVERRLRQEAVQTGAQAFLVRVHQRVARLLIGFEGERAERLEGYVGRPIYVRMDPAFHIEQVNIDPVTYPAIEPSLWMPRDGETVTAEVVEPDPMVTSNTLGRVNGYLMEIESDQPYELGQQVSVQVSTARRSFALSRAVTDAAT